MGKRSWWLGTGACLLAAALSGCGDASTPSATTNDRAASDEVSATLEIITTNIQSDTGDGFDAASPGQSLVEGDRVRTDDTGFAELTYHDGSWQRVEQNATLTIVELLRDDDVDAVRTGVDIGRSWNRVRELADPEDVYELSTPVATASVRGTAFSTDCATSDRCTFTVIEGTVSIVPVTGSAFELGAGETVTIVADQTPPEPSTLSAEELRQDEWIARNVGLDLEQDPTLPDPLGSDDGTDEEGLGSDEPCEVSGTIGDERLDAVPTSVSGEGETVEGDTLAVGRGFGFTVTPSDESVVQLTGSITVGEYAIGDTGGPILAVDVTRNTADGGFTQWFASSGRPDHDIAISGEPLVGAAVRGFVYDEGLDDGTPGPPLAIDLVVTCDPGEVPAAVPPAAQGAGPTATTPSVGEEPAPSDPPELNVGGG